MSTTAGVFTLEITPLESSALPSEDVILDAARQLIESTSSWKQGKTFYKNVKTYQHKDNNGAPWHCRLSEHPSEEASFEQFWDKLGKDKAINERAFIPEIKRIKKVKDVSPIASIWMLKYTFTPPVSARVFTVLQVFQLAEITPRTGIIVSIPVDLASLDDPELVKFKGKAIEGRYVSVERILELENGKTEWRMATSSNPGGLIPSFLAESTIPSKIARDVPHFVKWLHSLPK